MVTDVPRMMRRRAEYVRSDETRGLQWPPDDRLVNAARSIESALGTQEIPPVRRACLEFVHRAAEYHRVSVPQVRVLRSRPIRVREDGWGTELFGDCHFDEKLIGLWMRTAIQERGAMSFAANWTANGCDIRSRRIPDPRLL